MLDATSARSTANPDIALVLCPAFTLGTPPLAESITLIAFTAFHSDLPFEISFYDIGCPDILGLRFEDVTLFGSFLCSRIRT
jgi:hypothetical protein